MLRRTIRVLPTTCDLPISYFTSLGVRWCYSGEVLRLNRYIELVRDSQCEANILFKWRKQLLTQTHYTFTEEPVNTGHCETDSPV